MSFGRVGCAVLLCAIFQSSIPSNGQTATYHLHKETSSINTSFDKLLTAGPDASSLALTTALSGKAAGEYKIKEFETQTGVPNGSGIIRSGSVLNFNIWMRKTANVGTVFPRARVQLNSASGTLLCTATGSTALTTTVTKQALSCTTSGDISMTTADRYYLWVGVNLTGTSSSTFNGELDIEGTLNGNFDSQITVPLPATIPSISSIFPSSGPVGSTILIQGSNFGSTQGTSTVTFNGLSGSISSWSSTSIKAVVPAGATTGPLVVTVGGQSSSGVTYTVTPPPSITNASPSAAVVGTTVIVSGTNFGNSSGSISFNGIVASPVSWSDSSIQTTVPAGATTGNLVVTTAGGVASAGVSFIVVPPAAITSVSPNTGAPGTTVRISGLNFGASQGTGTVSFNGATGAILAWADNGITTVVPSGATSGNLVVTPAASTTASTAAKFSVINPIGVSVDRVVTGINGPTGPLSTNSSPELLLAFVAVGDGDVVGSVTGGGLTWSLVARSNVQGGSAEVWRAYSTSLLTNVQVTATLSSGSSQTALTVVALMGVDPSGTNGSGAIGAVATANSSVGPPSVALTTTRNNSLVFGVGSDISFLTNVAAPVPGPNQSVVSQALYQGCIDGPGCFSAFSDVLWIQQLSAAVPTSGTAVVLNDSSPSDAYDLVAVEVLPPVSVPVTPVITSLSPFIAVPGTPVTITGANFGNTQGASSAVQFNGISASPTTWSANSIVVPVPPGATTGNVVVTVSGQPSNGLRFLISNAAGLAVDQVVTGTNAVTPVFSTSTGNELLLALATLGPSSFGTQQLQVTSGGNLAWELVERTNTQQGSAEIWRAFSAGTVTDVQVDGTSVFGNTATTIVALVGIDTSGTNGSGAIGAIGSSNAATGPPSSSLVTTRDNSLVFAAGNDPTAAVARVLGNGQTLLAQLLNTQPASTLWAQQVTNSIPVTGSAVTVNDTAPSGDAYNLSIVEVRAPAVQTPSISSLSPSTGAVTTPVTISGTNFGNAQGSSTVTFGGVTATPTTWSATTITVPVPPGAPQGADAVVVTIPGVGTSNSATFTVVPALTITATPSPQPNAAGWNNTDVTIAYNCSGGVAPLQCPAPQVANTDGIQTIHAIATDVNNATASVDVPLKIDETPPGLSAIITPTPDSNGVVTGPATVNFACTDSTSGVSSCPAAAFFNSPGANQSIQVTATDNAGNSAPPVTVTLAVQTAPLAISLNAAPLANSAGWNNTSVTLSYTCTGGVPPVQCPFPQVADLEGSGQLFTATAVDAVGQGATARTTLNIDKTPPALSILSPADGSIFQTNVAAIQGSAIDTLSGVLTATCNGAAATVSGSSFSCSVSLAPGSNSISVSSTDRAGNTSTSNVSASFATPIAVRITSPSPRQLFSTGPVTVTGTVDNPSAAVTVNNIAATVNAGVFTAAGVILREGRNALTATASTTDGGVGSDSIAVTLDSTAPTIHIDSPGDAAIVTSPQITVSGSVNDAVSGTVNSQEVTVTVNGAAAVVSNRSFSAPDILLVPGQNTITAIATDSAGNTSQHQIHVTFRDLSAEQRIVLVSGNNQQGVVGSVLPNPLTVQLLDGFGRPLANRQVTFAIKKSDGLLKAFPNDGRQLTVATDSSGQASVQLQLGTRVGVGVNLVSVTAPGFVGEVAFSEDGRVGSPSHIHVVSGEIQQGQFGAALPEPLVAIVTDDGGNAVANATVVFKVEQGAGTLEGLSSVTKTTDSNGNAVAVLTLPQQGGGADNTVSASLAGTSATPAIFLSSAVVTGPVAATRLSGVVLDNANQPVPNATISIEGSNLSTVTNPSGQFSLTGVPVGAVILFVDGRSSTGTQVFPTLSFQVTTLPGLDNELPGPVFLPAIDADNSQVVGGDTDIVLTMKGVPGVAYKVFAHSVTFPDGSHTGSISVTQVHADRVPMSPPNGTAPRLIHTIQPPGVSFDPPIQMTLPNTEGLPAGQVVEILSYRHDLEQFVVEGTARVSEDGSVIVSDPNSGIRQSGWGGAGGAPAPTSCASSCNGCFIGAQCVNGTCQGGTLKTITGLVAQADLNNPDYVAFKDPGTSVSFTATSQGTCDQTTYKWDFGDSSSPGTGASVTHVYKKAGIYTANVTATCGSCQSVSASAQVVVNAMQLEIASPCTDHPDQCSLLPDPAMPVINGITPTVNGLNDPATVAATQFQWIAHVEHDANDCRFGLPDASYAAPDVLQTITGTQPFVPNFPATYGTDLFGGDFTLTVSATIHGVALTRKTSQQPNNDDEHIRGTDPRPHDLYCALPHDVLRKIACQESQWHQFTADRTGVPNACPLWSHDLLGGAGILQVTPVANFSGAQDLWDWTTSTADGVGVFRSKLSIPDGYPGIISTASVFQDAFAQLNLQRKANNLKPVTPVVPFFNRGAAGGDFNGNWNDTTVHQYERDVIQGFNGYCDLTGQYGTVWHQYRLQTVTPADMETSPTITVDEKALTGTVTWVWIPSGDRPDHCGASQFAVDPNYVDDVLNRSTTCGNAIATSCP